MKALKKYLRDFVKACRNNKFKALKVFVYIYPILPLGLLAITTLFWGFDNHLSNGFRYSSVSQVMYQFLLFSGGVSGLIGGLMVLLNRITPASVLLFLHGSISYGFIAIFLISLGFGGGGIFVFIHALYIAITIVVVAIQLYLILRQVITDYLLAKVVTPTMAEES